MYFVLSQCVDEICTGFQLIMLKIKIPLQILHELTQTDDVATRRKSVVKNSDVILNAIGIKCLYLNSDVILNIILTKYSLFKQL